MPAGNSAEAFARIGWDNSEARKGANELVNLSKQTKKNAEDALGSIGSGVKFAAAFAGFGSAANLLQKSFEGIGRGLNFNRQLSDAEVGISNILRRFDGLNKLAAKNEAGKALQRLVELEPVTAGGLQDLVDGFMGTLAASKGVGLSTQQNIELVAKFANAIANAGLPLDQIRQEFRSILSSTITKDSQIAKILGITNEDMNKIRGDGTAIFDFLTQKLGEFGEAGDSPTVAFSSLESAINKALGATTQQLFDLAVKSAKELTNALEDPAWVAQMKAAGGDLADVAKSLAQIGEVIVKWLPSMVRLGASMTEIVPSIAAIGAAIAALKLSATIKEKLALAQAAQQSTRAHQQETAALQQNAAAQQTNAAATAQNNVQKNKRSPFVGPATHGYDFGSSIDLGAAVTAARREGARASLSFMEGFKQSFRAFPQSAGGQMLASLNGMGPLIISTLSGIVTDRSKGLAGTIGQALGGETSAAMGPAIMDGLTVALSAAGPYGALSAAGLQLIDGATALGRDMGFALAKAMDEAQHGGAVQSRARGGTDEIRGLVDKGEEGQAKYKLEQRIQLAEEALERARANRDAESYAQLELELGVLRDMEKHWDAMVKQGAASRAKEKADMEATQAEQEAAAKKAEEEAAKRAKAWEQIRTLVKDISDTKISMLPDEQQIDALAARLRRVFEDAQLGAGGGGAIRSIADLEAEAQRQQSSGNAAGAALTLARLKEALALQQQMDAISKKMRESAADQSQEAERMRQQVEDRQAILGLEKEIQKTLAQNGGIEDERVKQLQDEIAIKQRMRDLQRDLNMDASSALSLAREIVQAERQATEAARERQQGEGLANLRQELEILRLQAAGRDEKARQMQRELEIQREVKRLMEETGMSEQKALETAREKARLLDQIEKRNGNSLYDEDGRRKSDGRKKIVSNRDGSTLPGESSGNRSSLDDFYEKQKTPLRDTFQFPGLDAFDQKQKTPLRDTFQFPGLDAYDQMQNKDDPLADKARQNNAEKDQNNPTVTAAQQVIQKMDVIITALN